MDQKTPRVRFFTEKQKILFSAIRDKDGHGKLIDVILPVTELDRANQIFECVLGQSQKQ